MSSAFNFPPSNKRICLRLKAPSYNSFSSSDSGNKAGTGLGLLLGSNATKVKYASYLHIIPDVLFDFCRGDNRWSVDDTIIL